MSAHGALTVALYVAAGQQAAPARHALLREAHVRARMDQASRTQALERRLLLLLLLLALSLQATTAVAAAAAAQAGGR